MNKKSIKKYLEFTTQGFACFPIHPDEKTPLTSHGFKDASMDPEQHRAWAGEFPDSNIAYLLPFPGYDRAHLTFAQLSHMVRLEYGNREWRHRLSAVNGVYLITDQRNGHHYVGSAYGASSDDGGIWRRWKSYVNSGGQGGNVGLISILGAAEAGCRVFCE